MDESKSFTHLQHTSSPNSVDRINTHWLPSAGLLLKVFFSTVQVQNPLFRPTLRWPLFNATSVTLWDPFWKHSQFLLWAGATSPPRQHICRLRKVSWYSRTFFPCSLCLFFMLSRQGAVKGDWWATAIYEHIAVCFLFGSVCMAFPWHLQCTRDKHKPELQGWKSHCWVVRRWV